MSPYPTPSTTSTPTSNASQLTNEATPTNDHRILIVVVILGIAAAFLIVYIIYITLRLKRRQDSGGTEGPYTGRVMNTDHPSSQITPFGAGGPYSGMTIPRFKHNPGEDMRIALRRPDGAWHFADSRTPFTPSGVSDLDILPSPSSMSSTTSLLSFHHQHRLPIPPLKEKDGHPESASASAKAQEAKAERYGLGSEFGASRTMPPPPPPAYYSEPCREHFDSRR